MSAQYNLTESQLADRLLNPRKGSNKFPALPEEMDEQGNVDIESYLNRAIETHPFLANKLQSNEPAKEPGYGTMLWQGVKRLPGIALDGITVAADVSLDEMLGVGEETLPHVSQAEYQKRIKAGETPQEIWPHLTKSHNRTWGDWMKMISVVDAPVEGVYDDPNTFVPEASERMEHRVKWYNEGGEVSQEGNWVDRDGNFAKKNYTWTPVEWKTEEQYENRKGQSYWSDGVLKTIRQDVLSEWIDPLTDKAMSNLWDRKIKQANNPQMQELQKWSQAHPWSEAWDDGVLGKKIFNAITGALPSYLAQIIVGGATFAITKNPSVAATVSAITGAQMDASEMFVSAYEYGKEQGFNDRDAKVMAHTYYEAYLAASMAWERVPFARMFRRTTNLPARKSVIRHINDNKVKRFILNAKETILNTGPIAGNKVYAMASQGVTEGLTELGQYATQVGLEANYKDTSPWPGGEVWDWNEALDAIVGGLGMGGITGIAGGKPITDKPGPTTVADTQKAVTALDIISGKPKGKKTTVSAAMEEDKETKELGAGASPISIPKTTSEYIEQIIRQDTDATSLNPQLVNLIKGENAKETPLTKRIFRDQASKYEHFPIRKIASIVEDEGWASLENSNLDADTKKLWKAKITQELIRQKKEPLEKKTTLTASEQSRLDKLDTLDIDSAISSIAQGKNIDSMLDEKIQKFQEKDVEEEFEKKFAPITPEMKRKKVSSLKVEGKKDISKVKAVTPIEITSDMKRKKVVAPKKETPEVKLARQIKEADLLASTYENQIKKAKTPEARAKAQKKLDDVNKRLEVLRKQKNILGEEEISKAFPDLKKKDEVQEVPKVVNVKIPKDIKTNTDIPPTSRVIDGVTYKFPAGVGFIKKLLPKEAQDSLERRARELNLRDAERGVSMALSEAVEKGDKKEIAKLEKRLDEISKEEKELEAEEEAAKAKDETQEAPKKDNITIVEYKGNTYELDETIGVGTITNLDTGKLINGSSVVGRAVLKKAFEGEEISKKVAPTPTPKPSIELGSDLDSKLAGVLDKVKIDNVQELGTETDTNGLTEKQSNAVNEEVADNTEELTKKNCLKKGE